MLTVGVTERGIFLPGGTLPYGTLSLGELAGDLYGDPPPSVRSAEHGDEVALGAPALGPARPLDYLRAADDRQFRRAGDCADDVLESSESDLRTVRRPPVI